MPLAFTPFAALTGPAPLTEEPREWGGPLDATGLMSIVVGHVGAAYRGRSNRRRRGNEARERQFVVRGTCVRRLEIKSEDDVSVARQCLRLEDLDGGETGAAGVMKRSSRRSQGREESGRCCCLYCGGGGCGGLLRASSFLEIYSHSQQFGVEVWSGGP